MMNLRSLSRKLEKLESSMQKDAKRLSKLIRKIKRAAASESAPRTRKAAGQKETDQAAVSSPTGRAKRKLTPEGRARLSAAMRERWAAKRAAAAPAASSSEAAPASMSDGMQQSPSSF
jgi:chromosome segregation ATPase